MEYVQIGTLITLFTASILLVVWLYRPGSDAKYDHYSEIPLKEGKKKEVKARARRRKKNTKK